MSDTEDRLNRVRRVLDSCVRENITDSSCPTVTPRKWQRPINNNACETDNNVDNCISTDGFRTPFVPIAELPVLPPAPTYTNTEITLNCTEGTGDTVVVLAGEFESTISQLDAQNKAQTAAQLRLNCYYKNTTQTINCNPVAGLGLLNTVPSSRNPSIVPLETYRIKVGETNLPIINCGAGNLSTSSQDYVDCLAYLAAVSDLECLVGNDEYTETCPLSGGYAALNTGGYSDSVTIPINTYTVKLADYVDFTAAKTAANVLAITAAQTSILCVYGNTGFTYTCFDKSAYVAGLYSYTIDNVSLNAGIFTVQLVTPVDIKFTNPSQNPLCVSPGGNYNNASTAITALTINNTLDQITFAENPTTTAIFTGLIASSKIHLPLNTASIVVTPALFVANTYTEAQALAVQFADLQLQCTFTAQTPIYDCSLIGKDTATLLNTPPTVPASSFISYVSQAQADQMMSDFYMTSMLCGYYNAAIATVTCSAATADTVLHSTSSRYPATNPAGQYDIPAGLFLSFVDQADANSQASNFLDSIKYCAYANTEITKQCTAGILRGASGSQLSYTVPINTFISTQLNTLKALTESFAISNLICLYYNDLQQVDCAAGPVYAINTPGIVAADTVIGSTPSEANNIALALAGASKVCIEQDLIGGSFDESNVIRLELRASADTGVRNCACASSISRADAITCIHGDLVGRLTGIATNNGGCLPTIITVQTEEYKALVTPTSYQASGFVAIENNVEITGVNSYTNCNTNVSTPYQAIIEVLCTSQFVTVLNGTAVTMSLHGKLATAAVSSVYAPS